MNRWTALTPVVAGCVIAGCGDDLTVRPDAAPAMRACTAQFSGAFNDASSDPGNCAMATGDPTDVSLDFAAASAVLGTPLVVAIELGRAPTPGTYTSETVASWSALAVTGPDSHQCFWQAGNASVPQGHFTLTLDDVDSSSAHGTLQLTVNVLAQPFTVCGTTNTESVTIDF